MKQLALFTAAMLVAAVPSLVLAQDCATPIQLGGGEVVNTDTTSVTDLFTSIGGVPAFGNEIVYTFTTPAAPLPAGHNITITNTTYNYGVSLVNACSEPVIGAGNFITGDGNLSGTDGSFSVSGLTPSTQYWIVVGGPPADLAPTSGTLTLTTPTPLPVELQKVSVE